MTPNIGPAPDLYRVAEHYQACWRRWKDASAAQGEAVAALATADGVLREAESALSTAHLALMGAAQDLDTGPFVFGEEEADA